MKQTKSLLNTLVKKDQTIIVGFSGGPDSVYLLTKLIEMRFDFNLTIIAAHLDHEWRTESAQDATWCANFCAQHHITFVSQKASDLNTRIAYQGSQEEYARNLRRLFFEQLAQRNHADAIALAHHLQDQIETFFIRLARGTSICGLTGIKPKDGLYIRPLLDITKDEILSFLHTNKLDFLQDPSNQDDRFLRNQIRNKLIPTLNQIDERYPKHILNTMQHLEQIDEFLHRLSTHSLQHITTQQEPLHVQTHKFLHLDPMLQQRILLDLLIKAQAQFTPSQALFHEITRFLHAQKSQTHQINQTTIIKKEKDSFSIVTL